MASFVLYASMLITLHVWYFKCKIDEDKSGFRDKSSAE